MISVIIPYYCKSNPVQTEQLLHRAIISASKELRECDSYEIIVVDNEKDLLKLLNYIKENNLKHKIIGGGTNLRFDV